MDTKSRSGIIDFVFQTHEDALLAETSVTTVSWKQNRKLDHVAVTSQR